MPQARLTILMPLYNKEAYIAEAIDSVMMQKTNFDFEVIIIDDKSTDRSLEIAQDYQNKYPEKIKLLFNEKNEGCLLTTIKGYELIKTEYFCLLDPDDYWIDQNKFQKAVDFLDNNPDFTMYIANTYIEENNTRQPYHTTMLSKDFDFEHLNEAIWGHTTAVVFRNVIFKHGVPEKLYNQLGTKNERCFEGDSFRNILHLREGKAHYEPNIEGVYRITNKGIWTSYNKFQQNTVNARLFLTMFLYFDNAHPNYFIGVSWWYCRANLELINNLPLQDENKKNTLEDIRDFYELLGECLKYQNIFLSNKSELSNYFLFYFPSKMVGGLEFLFIRLAAFLSNNIGLEVYYCDYYDGFARSQLSNTNVKFIDPLEPNSVVDLDKPINMIASITMAYEIPELKNPQSKLILWCTHPRGLEWLSARSGAIGNELNSFLAKLSSSNSVCFMDWSSWYATNDAVPVKFKEIYVPVFANEKNYGTLQNIHVINDEINIGWLGRLDCDKIYSLLNLLDNIYNFQTPKKKNVHIIGEGNSKHLIEVEKYSDQLNLIFTSTILNERLYEYLLKNIDILFAMGISALEAASLRIPSVLVFISNERIDSSDFLWLFDSQNYALGYYKEQKEKANIKTTPFSNIINEIYGNNKKEELGLKCYDYFILNHNVEMTVGRLLLFVLNICKVPDLKVIAISRKLLRRVVNLIIYHTRFGKVILRLRTWLRSISSKRL